MAAANAASLDQPVSRRQTLTTRQVTSQPLDLSKDRKEASGPSAIKNKKRNAKRHRARVRESEAMNEPMQ